MKKLFLFIISVAFSLSSFAQYYDWTVYNTSNSPLQSNEVMCLAVDHDSTIWIGAGNIVYKLDNGNWTVYDTVVIGHNGWRVQQITVDNNNNKWFATLNGMLKYDNNSWTVYTTENSNIPTDYIWSIAADHDNKIWFSSPDGPGGFYNYDGNNWNIYNVDSSQNLFFASANRIAVDAENTKYFSGNGLHKYDNTEWTHEVIYIDFNEQIGDVSSIDINTNGDRWLSYDQYITAYTNSGTITYDDEDTGFPIYHTNRVAFDSSGYVWAGGGAGRLARFNGTEWNQYSPANSPLPTNGGIGGAQISDIVIGWDGKIYVSTFQGGLAVLEKSTTGVDCSNSNYIPTISASAPFIFCYGDSITLQAQQGYDSYLWSTGATTRSITIHTAGEYFVTVPVDACLFTSDTINAVISSPQPVIFGDSDGSLIASPAFVSYQWYQNNTLIPNATAQVYCPEQTGYAYHVEVINEYGCVGISSGIEIDSEWPLNCLNGIDENNSFTSTLYPNPATNSATLEFENPTNSTFGLQVFDITGRVVMEQNAITSNRITLNTHHLPVGIYHYRLISEKEKKQSFGKLVVE
jgi:hypothetical protein